MTSKPTLRPSRMSQSCAAAKVNFLSACFRPRMAQRVLWLKINTSSASVSPKQLNYRANKFAWMLPKKKGYGVEKVAPVDSESLLSHWPRFVFPLL